MKRFILIISLLISLLLVSCSKKEKEIYEPLPGNDEIIIPEHESLLFNYKEIRVYWPASLKSSKITSYQDYLDSGLEYGYEQDFFNDKGIYVFGIDENSGSIRHTITDLFIYDDKLFYVLDTYYPSIGTCDMASYHIVIECDKQLLSYEIASFSTYKYDR